MRSRQMARQAAHTIERVIHEQVDALSFFLANSRAWNLASRKSVANVSASCHQLRTSGGCMREWESRTLSGSRSHLLSTTVRTFSPDGRTTHAFDLIARSSSCRLAAHEGKELRFNHRARDANKVQLKAARCCRQRQRSREGRGQFGAQMVTTRQRSESLHPRMRRTAGGGPHKASAEQRCKGPVRRKLRWARRAHDIDAKEARVRERASGAADTEDVGVLSGRLAHRDGLPSVLRWSAHVRLGELRAPHIASRIAHCLRDDHCVSRFAR